MKILWIGSLAWNDGSNSFDDLSSSGSVSGSLFEQQMIEGLESFGTNVDILNSYPYGDGKYHNSFYWSHNGTSKDYSLIYVKHKYINLFFEFFQLWKFVNSVSDKYDAVIVYLIHSPFLYALKKIKKKTFDTKTVLICPDLSDMMDMQIKNNLLKKFAKRMESILLNDYYKYVDGYVLFSKYMKERLPINSKPYIVIEGINSIDKRQTYREKKNSVVVYAGSLQKNFGIENLINSWNLIDEKIELHIYGDGVLSDFVKKKSLKDDRIKYFGFIQHKSLIEKEHNCWLLVNVRDPEQSYTKYSFPSKMFEYIMSGRPVLTTRLKGIQEEYFEYVFTIPDNSPETIADSIKSIFYMDEEYIENKVRNGIRYISENKSKNIQAKKMLAFLEGLNDE